VHLRAGESRGRARAHLLLPHQARADRSSAAPQLHLNVAKRPLRYPGTRGMRMRWAVCSGTTRFVF